MIRTHVQSTDCPALAKSQNWDDIFVQYSTFNDATIDHSFSPCVSDEVCDDKDGILGFNLGQGRVIRGLDLGLVGLCVGDEVRIDVPWQMAKNDTGTGKK